MSGWSPFVAAIWTMGQLAWPAMALGAVIVLGAMLVRDRRLLLFLLSLALSEALLFAAGLFERSLDDSTWPTLIFLGGQSVLLVWLARLAKGERGAVILAALCFIYAVIASAVAGMGFTGDWL
jgi:hypothetical protein